MPQELPLVHYSGSNLVICGIRLSDAQMLVVKSIVLKHAEKPYSSISAYKQALLIRLRQCGMWTEVKSSRRPMPDLVPKQKINYAEMTSVSAVRAIVIAFTELKLAEVKPLLSPAQPRYTPGSREDALQWKSLDALCKLKTAGWHLYNSYGENIQNCTSQTEVRLRIARLLTDVFLKAGWALPKDHTYDAFVGKFEQRIDKMRRYSEHRMVDSDMKLRAYIYAASITPEHLAKYGIIPLNANQTTEQKRAVK